MEQIRVWTKQHESALTQLERTGRYTAKKRYVELENEDCAPIVLEAYDWLVKHVPNRNLRPADAEYPVWVSLARETTMLPEPGRVILGLEVDRALLAPIHVGKWGMILNYSYIPASPEDEARHKKLLSDYRVSDVTAYMSQFYPAIKREIVSSWERLFDPAVQVGGNYTYAILWELRSEWMTSVER